MNIRYIYFICILFACNTKTTVPQDENIQIKEEMLSKWENSVKYSMDLFSKLEDSHLTFKPTEEQMDIAGQITHMCTNMHRLGNIIHEKPANIAPIDSYSSVENLLNYFEQSCQYIEDALNALNVEDLTDKVDFAGRKLSKREIIYLINDHHTHHRGQLVVYLRLLDKEPVPYIGF